MKSLVIPFNPHCTLTISPNNIYAQQIASFLVNNLPNNQDPAKQVVHTSLAT